MTECLGLLARSSRHMDPKYFWPLFGGVLLVFGLVYWLSWLFEKKRTGALRLMAGQLNLQFFPKDGPFDAPLLADFHLGSQGRAREVRNLMVGQAGDVDVALFDYLYTTGHGKHARTHLSTVAHFRSATLATPRFELRPEGLLDKIGGAFGSQDIDFASHPVFSRAYLLRGHDEAAIRRFFDDQLLTELESAGKVAIESRPSEMLCYRPEEKCAPEDYARFLQEAHRLFAQLSDAAQRQA